MAEKVANILLLNPEDLIIDWSANGRYKASEVQVDDLVESIQKEGQIEPIEVRRRPDGSYIVTLGFRRTMAIRQINHLMQPGEERMKIACMVVAGNSEDAFRRNVEENLRRQELTPMDIADQIRKWRNIYHKTDQQIAERYGKSVSWVISYARLLSLEPAEQELVHQGSLSLWAGVELSRFEEDVRNLIVNLLHEDGKTITRENVVKKGRELKKLSKIRKRSRKELVEDLSSVTSSPAYPEQVRNLLEYVVEYFNGLHNLDELHKLVGSLSKEMGASP